MLFWRYLKFWLSLTFSLSLSLWLSFSLPRSFYFLLSVCLVLAPNSRDRYFQEAKFKIFPLFPPPGMQADFEYDISVLAELTRVGGNRNDPRLVRLLAQNALLWRKYMTSRDNKPLTSDDARQLIDDPANVWGIEDGNHRFKIFQFILGTLADLAKFLVKIEVEVLLEIPASCFALQTKASATNEVGQTRVKDSILTNMLYWSEFIKNVELTIAADLDFGQWVVRRLKASPWADLMPPKVKQLLKAFGPALIAEMVRLGVRSD